MKLCLFGVSWQALRKILCGKPSVQYLAQMNYFPFLHFLSSGLHQCFLDFSLGVPSGQRNLHTYQRDQGAEPKSKPRNSWKASFLKIQTSFIFYCIIKMFPRKIFRENSLFRKKCVTFSPINLHIPTYYYLPVCIPKFRPYYLDHLVWVSF